MENLNIKVSGHEVYKAVRNFIINENQVSKEIIHAEVEKIIGREVEKYINAKLHDQTFYKALRNAIGEYIAKGIPGRSAFHENTNFGIWLQENIKAMIKEEIFNKYEVNIGEKN